MQYGNKKIYVVPYDENRFHANKLIDCRLVDHVIFSYVGRKNYCEMVETVLMVKYWHSEKFTNILRPDQTVFPVKNLLDIFPRSRSINNKYLAAMSIISTIHK